MDSFLGGSQKQKQTSTFAMDPTIQALNSLKLSLAGATASGDITSSMRGFIDKVLIPSTTNTLTAAGLGRSGAIGEAVANAVLSQGTGFIESLLSGIPSGLVPTSSTSTSSRGAGLLDWLGALTPLASPLFGYGGVFGQTPSR